MEYMFQPGFLGTGAPFFMDAVTLVVALLPLLVGLAILLAKKGRISLHSASQWFLFAFSVIIIGYFEYGVRAGGGFETFVKSSSLSRSSLFYFLIFHIIVSILTVLWWSFTIISGTLDYRRGTLPGKRSSAHRKLGYQSAWGIFATSLTGIWVYLLLFVY